ncbi:hypothetical protein BD324DRAFT_638240 [Kockovaella imperatae]|uniref:Uncharacterized protein n=1 Tax=Kockovaella imperatae TaxID=4999 RepID=A0A1Y1U7T3_9TREE|nr:hypothetical protein BD324DRAFT_638240 [Kockovaella imperatae]ORX34062.1 hypothetical protein BD324DRAFT_638240 [Kockovaella imperatae]
MSPKPPIHRIAPQENDPAGQITRYLRSITPYQADFATAGVEEAKVDEVEEGGMRAPTPRSYHSPKRSSLEMFPLDQEDALRREERKMKRRAQAEIVKPKVDPKTQLGTVVRETVKAYGGRRQKQMAYRGRSRFPPRPPPWRAHEAASRAKQESQSDDEEPPRKRRKSVVSGSSESIAAREALERANHPQVFIKPEQRLTLPLESARVQVAADRRKEGGLRSNGEIVKGNEPGPSTRPQISSDYFAHAPVPLSISHSHSRQRPDPSESCSAHDRSIQSFINEHHLPSPGITGSPSWPSFSSASMASPYQPRGPARPFQRTPGLDTCHHPGCSIVYSTPRPLSHSTPGQPQSVDNRAYLHRPATPLRPPQVASDIQHAPRSQSGPYIGDALISIIPGPYSRGPSSGSPHHAQVATSSSSSRPMYSMWQTSRQQAQPHSAQYAQSPAYQPVLHPEMYRSSELQPPLHLAYPEEQQSFYHENHGQVPQINLSGGHATNIREGYAAFQDSIAQAELAEMQYQQHLAATMHCQPPIMHYDQGSPSAWPAVLMFPEANQATFYPGFHYDMRYVNRMRMPEYPQGRMDNPFLVQQSSDRNASGGRNQSAPAHVREAAVEDDGDASDDSDKVSKCSSYV